MRIDARDLAVTATEEAVIAASDDFTMRLLRTLPGAEAVFPAAQRFPEAPILQLHAAAAHLFAQSEPGDRAAEHFLARAGAVRAAMNPREARLFEALSAWRGHAFSAAVTTLESVTTDWPRDLLAAKYAEFLYYVLGQQHEGARFRRHMERLEPHHARDPDFLAMLAFARELTGDFDAAVGTAERALGIGPDTPWADHALSHVWLRRGEVLRAIAHLEAALPRWRGHVRPIHAHDAWHLALHHVDRLDVDRALVLLDGEIWRDEEDEVGLALDAIALLWRIEMVGLAPDAASRWPAIADRAELHVGTPFMPFLSAHLAYALARAGRDAALERLLAAARGRAAAAPGDADARRAWAPVGVALVEASAAFGAGDHRGTVDLLEPVIAGVTVGGGSDAQCDLFRLTFIRALAGSGRRAEATARLGALLAGRAPTPLDEVWRAAVV